MLTLLSEVKYLSICPQTEETLSITSTLSFLLYRNAKANNFDHVKPVILSDIFTFKLCSITFTFNTTRGYFTLSDIVACLITAWNAPLSPKQLNYIMIVYPFRDEKYIGKIMTLSNIFSPFQVDGLIWSNGFYILSDGTENE